MSDAIENMKPGGRVVISESNETTFAAERSGDGRTLRYVRETRDGFVVVRSESFPWRAR